MPKANEAAAEVHSVASESREVEMSDRGRSKSSKRELQGREGRDTKISGCRTGRCTGGWS